MDKKCIVSCLSHLRKRQIILVTPNQRENILLVNALSGRIFFGNKIRNIWVPLGTSSTEMRMLMIYLSPQYFTRTTHIERSPKLHPYTDSKTLLFMYGKHDEQPFIHNGFQWDNKTCLNPDDQRVLHQYKICGDVANAIQFKVTSTMPIWIRYGIVYV